MNIVAQKMAYIKSKTNEELAELLAINMGKRGKDGKVKLHYTRSFDLALEYLDVLDITDTEYLVLSWLMKFAPKKGILPVNTREIYPSITKLANTSPHSRQKITRAKNSLIKKNYIVVEKSNRKTDTLILTNFFTCVCAVGQLKSATNKRSILMDLFDEFREERGFSQLERSNRNTQQKKAAKLSLEKRQKGIPVELPNLTINRRKQL